MTPPEWWGPWKLLPRAETWGKHCGFLDHVHKSVYWVQLSTYWGIREARALFSGYPKYFMFKESNEACLSYFWSNNFKYARREHMGASGLRLTGPTSVILGHRLPWSTHPNSTAHSTPEHLYSPLSLSPLAICSQHVHRLHRCPRPTHSRLANS